MLTDEEWEAAQGRLAASDEDRQAVADLMVPDYEYGEFAGWIAPPNTGINDQPVEFDYVHLAEEGPHVSDARPAPGCPTSTPVWDADKQRIIGGAPEGAFVLPFRRRRAAGRVVVGPRRRRRRSSATAASTSAGAATPRSCSPSTRSARSEGVGTFVLGSLEDEALRRGLNYVYNTVREHSERDLVHDWLVVRGFRGAVDGDLRKRVAFARQAPTPGEVATDARPGPSRAASGGGSYDPRPPATWARVTRSPAATSTSTTTGTEAPAALSRRRRTSPASTAVR